MISKSTIISLLWIGTSEYRHHHSTRSCFFFKKKKKKKKKKKLIFHVTSLVSLETLLHRQPASSKSHITLFGSYDPSLPQSAIGRPKTRAPAIEDPYYGGRDGFDKSFESCVKFSNGFLDWLERNRS